MYTYYYYNTVYDNVKASILQQTGNGTAVAHVGGTSLEPPIGKGDVDVYVMYDDQHERNVICSKLQQLYGQPANETPLRTRFGDYANGVEIEINVVGRDAFEKACLMRSYLQSHREEALRYEKSRLLIRTKYRDRLAEITQHYADRATEWGSRDSRQM